MARPRKKKAVVDPDTKARQSMAQMAEMTRLLNERVGADAFQKAVFSLPDDKRREVFAKLARLDEIRTRDKCRLSFDSFVDEMWPGNLPGPHFEVMTNIFHRIDAGEPVRAIVCLPPRFGKSERLSYLFPAWYIGKHPENQIIQASNVKSLATMFGGKIRNLVNTEDYKKIFPGITLAADTSAKDRWDTNKGGKYFSVGAGGTVVGRGANLLIIDDPHSEQSIVGQGAANQMPSKEDFEKVYNWFTSIRGRLEPKASVLIVMQRWAPFDLVGRLTEDMKMKTSGDQWEIIELPALIEKRNEDGTPIVDMEGNQTFDSLWPQRWSVEELLKLKASLPSWKWNAQYMQDPRSDESAIIKREFWKIWGQKITKTDSGFELLGEIDHNKEPPKCEYVIQSWDTAYTAKTRSDYSACTTWGVFKVTLPHGKDGREREVYNIILLEAARWKCEFQDLKKHAVDQYRKHNPDTCIIEAKAAGLPLVSELRKAGIPVSDYTPTARSGDKLSRVNAVSDLFASGYVYIPPRHWAEDVMEEFALFPNGEHDDYVDSCTQALLRFRMGGFMSSRQDEEEEEYVAPERKYY